jgi:hypothetical protein
VYLPLPQARGITALRARRDGAGPILDDGRVASEHVDAIITDLESFLVRRLVCNLTTKNYNRLFLQILGDLDGAVALTPDKFRQALLSRGGESTHWPGDDEFRKALLTHPIYDQLGPGRVEMILRALELAQLNDKGERVTVHGDLTIEHVLPQSWEEHWPLPSGGLAATDDDGEFAAARSRLLHTVGNLTLLTHKLNASVSNGPYAAKRPAICGQSALRLNAYFQAIETWNEEEIEARGVKLFEVAARVWPHSVQHRMLATP